MNTYSIDIKSSHQSGNVIVQADSSGDAICRLLAAFPDTAVIRNIKVRKV